MPVQATDANDDTYQAIVQAWQRDSTLSGLFPVPVRAGRLKSQEGQNLSPPGLDAPYAQVLVEKGKTDERNTGIVYLDYRNVTITAIGTKAQASQALPAMLEVYHRGLVPWDLAYLVNLAPSQTGGVKYRTLTYPFYSFRKFLRWWPLNDGELIEDDATKKGKDVWRAVVRGEITSIMAD